MGAEIETCTCENCGANDLYKEHLGKWKCSYCKTKNMCTRCIYSRPGRLCVLVASVNCLSENSISEVFELFFILSF